MSDETDHEIVQHETTAYEMEERDGSLVATDTTHVGKTFECTCGEEFDDRDAALDHVTRHPIEEALDSTAYTIVDEHFDGGPISTYFDVDRMEKLGVEFYEAVRDSGYVVTATQPRPSFETTRVWIDEQED
jgi:hypothetical protein